MDAQPRRTFLVQYLHDLVYGANDGVITTFTVIAGSSGAALGPFALIALGLANILGDGLSMGLGNYLATKSERDYQQAQREKQAWRIENLPEMKQRDLHNILERWGVRGPLQRRLAETIMADPESWVEVLMREELGIVEEQSSPAKHAAATFVAFVIAGTVPLLPFLLGDVLSQPLLISSLLAALTLFIVGALRTQVTGASWWRGGLEMLAVGAVAGLGAYGVGMAAGRLFGGG